MQDCKINVLGTKYSLFFRKRDEDEGLKENDGYCDKTSKELVVCVHEPEIDSVKNLEVYEKKVARHEIIHAFIEESGLSENTFICKEGWAKNEEMVDWISAQFPKIFTAFSKADVM